LGALVTGISGQDGSYLAELLLEKGYEVHGIVRRASSFNTGRLDRIYPGPARAPAAAPPPLWRPHRLGGPGEPDQGRRTRRGLPPGRPEPREGVVRDPEYTGEATGLGTTRLLEAVRASGVATRFYQASSSEMYGAATPPQDELTPFHPRSPYGCAKVNAYLDDRELPGGLRAVRGQRLLFNHESPRRGETFVTRKVTRAVARIKAGMLASTATAMFADVGGMANPIRSSSR
jgi:GDPmannose 4,6-dehydratase